MDIVNLASHIATHNGTLSDINNDVYHIGDTALVAFSPDKSIIASSPELSNFIINATTFHLPSKENCHYYQHGVCIFTHNEHLMFYSHMSSQPIISNTKYYSTSHLKHPIQFFHKYLKEDLLHIHN